MFVGFLLSKFKQAYTGVVINPVKQTIDIEEDKKKEKSMRWSLVALMLFAGALFGGVSTATAASQEGPTLNTQIDDDDKEPSLEEMKKQVEATFANMLQWDEKTKKFTIKKEFTKDLPVPAPLIENFLNGFLKNDNGRPVVGDDERFKQMLPMLKRFMGQGRKEMERFKDMNPEERQKALKKAQGYGKILKNPKARDGMKKLGKIMKPGNKPRLKKAPKKAPAPKVLPKLSKPDFKNLPDMGGLDGIKDIVNGLVRLSKIMKTEDWQRVAKVLQSVVGEFDPADVQDPQKLMQKLQKVMDPSDLERFMEVLSDFLETEEGQAFESRVEKLVSDLENFMSSERGQKLMDTFRKLGERLQGAGGGDLPKNFKKLFGRDSAKGKKKTSEKKSRRRSKREVVSRLY
jgi:hypothetical protein